jgi:gliding motility-associated-like protein
MTKLKLITSIYLCCFLFPVLSGQQQDFPSDSLSLTQEQLQRFENMAADTVGGELVVPNVFTPNGDQVNDYFEVTTDGVTVYELTFFTRTGTRIYYSRSPRIYWDGRSLDGKELPEGVYYYVIEEVGASDPFEKAGFIHLFR